MKESREKSDNRSLISKKTLKNFCKSKTNLRNKVTKHHKFLKQMLQTCVTRHENSPIKGEKITDQ